MLINIRTNNNLRVIRKHEDEMFKIYKKLLGIKSRLIIETFMYLFRTYISRYLLIKMSQFHENHGNYEQTRFSLKTFSIQMGSLNVR